MSIPAPVRRYHRIDGWRGYQIPALAVVGASDTGGWSDSPCPTREVKAELRRFRKEVLRPAGIPSRMRSGRSSNAFCGKRWIVVPVEHFQRAWELALPWLDAHKADTRFIHEAT